MCVCVKITKIQYSDVLIHLRVNIPVVTCSNISCNLKSVSIAMKDNLSTSWLGVGVNTHKYLAPKPTYHHIYVLFYQLLYINRVFIIHSDCV